MSSVISATMISLTFILIRMMLFICLATFQLDLKLLTQVTGDGKIAILAVNKFDREVLRFNIDVTTN